MNILDIFLLLPFLWFGFKGLSNGFLKELFSTFALFLGIYAAIHFSSYTGNLLSDIFNSQSSYWNLIIFAITFIISLFAIKLGVWVFEKLFSSIGIGWLNKIGGLILGCVKAFLLVGTTIFIIQQFDSNDKLLSGSIKNESILYQPLKNITVKIYPSLISLINKSKSQQSELD